MQATSREQRLRRMAEQQGLELRKQNDDYMIFDPKKNVVVAGGPEATDPYILTLDDVEAWLAEQE
jgi:hypothetical protein